VPKGAKAKSRKKATVKKKKTLKVTDVNGIIHVKSSFNNTMITVTDRNGNVITWASGGTTGVKGTRKGTAFASGQAAVQAAEKAIEAGLKKVEIWVRGPGSGREAAVRALQSTNLEVTAIKDQTRIPHNGCRLSKRRRRG
jgi:small subunit ribosomal protein S11